MSPDVKTFRRVERVGVIYDLLANTEHDCFPVLNAEDGGVLVGTVLRKALCVILQVCVCVCILCVCVCVFVDRERERC